jgi:hypothetical protein
LAGRHRIASLSASSAARLSTPPCSALKRATHGGLAFHPYAADAAAEKAIDDQAIYGALVLDQGVPRVLVSSASGYSVAVAALFCSTVLVLVSRWAIIPTWTLFVILGNTSSGGAVAQPLPPFYAFIGRFLPPGATVSIVRTAVYFRRDQHLERSSSRRSGWSVPSPRCSSRPGVSAGDRRSEATSATTATISSYSIPALPGMRSA